MSLGNYFKKIVKTIGSLEDFTLFRLTFWRSKIDSV
jgi:hypothetical protein